MVGGVYGAIGAILAGGILLAKFFDVWLRDVEKQKFAEFLNASFMKTDNVRAIVFIQGPVKALHILFNLILGSDQVFSRKPFIRGAILSNILLFTCFAVSSAFTEIPWPWNIYDTFARGNPRMVEIWDKQIASYERAAPSTQPTSEPLTQAATEPTTEPQSQLLAPLPPPISDPTGNTVKLLKEVRAFQNFVKVHDGIMLKISYCIVYFLGVIFVNSILSFICIAFARQLLRDLVHAETFFTYLAVFIFNIVATLVFAAIALLTLFLIGVPYEWPVMWMFLRLAFNLPVKAVVGIIVGGALLLSVLIWFLGGLAMKIQVAVAILPLLLVLTALFCRKKCKSRWSYATPTMPYRSVAPPATENEWCEK